VFDSRFLHCYCTSARFCFWTLIFAFKSESAHFICFLVRNCSRSRQELSTFASQGFSR
jgi:hypothetical protein